MPSPDRYLVLLRGINVGQRRVSMPQLASSFEAMGYQDVKTLLGSGNVIFTAHEVHADALVAELESALKERFGFAIPVIVRSLAELQALADAGPFQGAPADARLNVTFFASSPPPSLVLPPASGITITSTSDLEICSAVATTVSTLTLMDLLEKTYGKVLTTRRWDTIRKALAA